MNIWFSSDWHMFHDKIRKYCNRNFDTAEEMTYKIIENYNSVVKPNDIFYHLGDFCFGSTEMTIDILKKINGKKHLIMGNHDKKALKSKKILQHVEWVKDIYEISIYEPSIIGKKQHIVLCHYPLLSWNRQRYGAWHLHGHCHSNIDHMNKTTLRLDVGVDGHNFMPLSYEQIKEIMKNKQKTLKYKLTKLLRK